MPNTTNFNWPTPADTDLVKDGAAAIRNLGDGVDTSLVDLKGGTTGQILSKASNADMDFVFITPNVGDLTEVQAGVGISVASGTGPIPIITNSSTDLITTAGDLLYGTAADTVARLGIGTAGQVLKVNSGATAPEWAVDPTTDVVTTAGDLIYGTAADTVARLGIGTAGQVLKVNSGATAPEWGAAAGASFVGVSLKKSADQSITLNTATTVSFNQESYDTDGFHDNVTNNSRITIPSGKGGYYAINATVDWQQSANATNRQIRLLKNGTLINLVIQQDPGNNVDAWTIQCNTVLDLAATDYLEIQVFTGTTLNVQAVYTTAILTFFNATYLGA